MDEGTLRGWAAAFESRAADRARERERARVELMARAVRAAELLRERYGARRVGVFGSILREEFDEHSDVDLYVDELEKGDYFVAVADVSELLGRAVDLVELGRAAPSLCEYIEDSGRDLP